MPIRSEFTNIFLYTYIRKFCFRSILPATNTRFIVNKVRREEEKYRWNNRRLPQKIIVDISYCYIIIISLDEYWSEKLWNSCFLHLRHTLSESSITRYKLTMETLVTQQQQRDKIVGINCNEKQSYNTRDNVWIPCYYMTRLE